MSGGRLYNNVRLEGLLRIKTDEPCVDHKGVE